MPDISKAIEKATQKAIDSYGRYEETHLKKLFNLHLEARRNIEREIASRWALIPKDVTSTAAIRRLREMQRAVTAEMEIFRAKLANELPEMVKGAGDKGIQMGQSELEALLANMDKTITPSFSILNKQAIEVYSEYALQLSDADTVQALKQIQSRLQLGLIQGDTVGKLTTDIRQMIGAERGKPAKGLTAKARRIARTEGARSFEAGHTAYGKSTDWIIGERHRVNPVGPWPCSICEPLEGNEYYYDKGESAGNPQHPNGRCYTTYIYRSDLFTPAEITQMREEAGVTLPIKGPVILKPSAKIKTGIDIFAHKYGGYKTERATHFDSLGNQFLFKKQVGKTPQLAYNKDEIVLLRGKGAIVVHNHPNGSSFSMEDIGFSSYANEKQTWVVGKEYKYSLQPKAGKGWPTGERIQRVYGKYEEVVAEEWKNDVYQLISTPSGLKPRLTERAASIKYSHIIMKNTAKELGLEYTRIPVGG